MRHFRQLAAIVFTDIEGYSDMMQKNEDVANSLREKMENVITEQVGLHEGRVIRFDGDGSICVFNSAIEAVNAAIGIQLEMKIEPTVPLRIGIHTGDIVSENDNIYGDGVNIASRIESFSVAGGILVSEKVNDEIRNHPEIKTVSLGRYLLKNIDHQVELFAISNSQITVPSRNRLAGKGIAAVDTGLLSRKNIRRLIAVSIFLVALIGFYKKYSNKGHQYLLRSIAVMPLTNLDNNPEMNYFANGITEDILTQISKIGDLTVISYSTTNSILASSRSLAQIGRDFNAGSILQGTIAKIRDSVRIFVRLVDASTSELLWAESYKKSYEEIFDIQSEIAQHIADVLEAKITEAEKARIERKPTENLTAYENYLKGRDYYYRYKKAANDSAIDFFKSAIWLDSNYALAWAGLGDAYSQKFGRFGFSDSWIDSSKAAGLMAIKLDSTSSEAFKALANAYNYASQYDSGFLLLQTAVRLNPNNAPAVGNLGTGYFLRGDLPMALKWEKKAAAVNPKNNIPYMIIGWTYRLLTEYREAENWFKKSLELKPFKDSYRELAFTYLFEGKKEEALKLVPFIINSDTTSKTSYEEAGLVCLHAGEIQKAKTYFQKSIQLNQNLITDAFTNAPVGLGDILIKEGKNIDAEILLSPSLSLFIDEIKNGKTDDELRIGAAAVLAIQDKKQEAINWLQQAANVNWIDYVMVETSPWFDNIRNEPGYTQLNSRIKSKVNKMKEAAKEF